MTGIRPLAPVLAFPHHLSEIAGLSRSTSNSAPLTGPQAGRPGGAEAIAAKPSGRLQNNAPAPHGEPATGHPVAARHDLSLELHEASGRWFVVVREYGSDRVLYTVPPEALLNILARIRQAIGLFIDAYA